jgi:hypothetical protein
VPRSLAVLFTVGLEIARPSRPRDPSSSCSCCLPDSCRQQNHRDRERQHEQDDDGSLGRLGLGDFRPTVNRTASQRGTFRLRHRANPITTGAVYSVKK